MSFEAIYRRYHQALYRYCLAILGNPEDALQNTMVKAMRALQGEKRQIKLKPWLYRIAHNESIDMLRRRRPTEEIDAGLAAGEPGAAEAAETRERLRRLIADLDELPDRQRGALVMRELSGLSFEQIGAGAGKVVAAVGVGAADRGGLIHVAPSGGDSAPPDKKASAPLHGQKTSNGRNDEVAHQNRGNRGSAGTKRGAGGSSGGSAQHGPPRQPGNGAQPGQLPGTGADVHAGQSGQTHPGPESGAAGKGEGLRPLLPG